MVYQANPYTPNAPQKMEATPLSGTKMRAALANRKQRKKHSVVAPSPVAALNEKAALKSDSKKFTLLKPRKAKATKAKTAKVKAPKVKAPKAPKVKAPKAPKVKAPKAPKVKAPKPPKVKAPKLRAPKKPKRAKKVKVNKAQTNASLDRRRTDRRSSASKTAVKKSSNLAYQSLHKYIRLSYISLFLLVFVLGGWSVLAKIQGAVIATGQVAVDGKPKVVQHLEGGIVSDISVKEGDYVSQGQNVLKLDSTILNANLDAAETNYFENQALISRLKAEQNGQDKIYWSRQLPRHGVNSRVDLAKSGQEQLFHARRSALSGEIAQFSQRIEQFRDEDTGLISEIDFTRSELGLVEQELSKMTNLLRQNLVSRNRVTQLERDSTRLMNTAAKLESRRTGLQNAIREAEIQIAQTRRLREEEVLTDLRVAQTQADSYNETLKTVSTKTKLVGIEAPVSGIVHEMTVTTIGGVIAPGQEIMQIIPKRDSLVIKAHVMPQDIDQVTLGQKTNVIFSALKQSAAPELDGTVSFISADALVDSITGSAYFEVDVEIADAEIVKLNGQTLIPGMPADVFIQTQEQTVFDYIMGPLRDTLKKTMRDG